MSALFVDMDDRGDWRDLFNECGSAACSSTLGASGWRISNCTFTNCSFFETAFTNASCWGQLRSGTDPMRERCNWAHQGWRAWTCAKRVSGRAVAEVISPSRCRALLRECDLTARG
jgi:hypothetical protein